MRAFRLLLLIALATAAWSARADVTCARAIVCTDAIETADGVDLYVENLNSADITVTVEVVLDHMTADRPLPYTTSLVGNQRVKLLTLTRDARASSWSYRHRFAWTWGNTRAAHDDDAIYALPYPEGQAYRIDQGYHGRFSHYGDMEYAIDWNMPEGTPVCAARAGVVVGVEDRYTEGGPRRDYQNRVNYVMIKHADGTIGEYVHLKPDSARIRVSDRVRAGEVIALSGNTGFSTGPHLHFFVYKALDGLHRQSFPVHFLTESRTITLAEGHSYRAVGAP